MKARVVNSKSMHPIRQWYCLSKMVWMAKGLLHMSTRTATGTAKQYKYCTDKAAPFFFPSHLPWLLQSMPQLTDHCIFVPSSYCTTVGLAALSPEAFAIAFAFDSVSIKCISWGCNHPDSLPCRKTEQLNRNVFLEPSLEMYLPLNFGF